jgi:hypothetical protein
MNAELSGSKTAGSYEPVNQSPGKKSGFFSGSSYIIAFRELKGISAGSLSSLFRFTPALKGPLQLSKFIVAFSQKELFLFEF